MQTLRPRDKAGRVGRIPQLMVVARDGHRFAEHVLPEQRAGQSPYFRSIWLGVLMTICAMPR